MLLEDQEREYQLRRNIIPYCFMEGSCYVLPKPQAGEPPIVGLWGLVIEYIRSYPPYLLFFVYRIILNIDVTTCEIKMILSSELEERKFKLVLLNSPQVIKGK
jgi:hypothetical protein